MPGRSPLAAITLRIIRAVSALNGSTRFCLEGRQSFAYGGQKVTSPDLLPLLLCWELLALGFGDIAKLLFGHRLYHLFRGSFEAGFLDFSAFRGQGSACGHLLLLGFCRHIP